MEFCNTCHDVVENTAFPITLVGRPPCWRAYGAVLYLEESAKLPAVWIVPCLRFNDIVPPCERAGLLTALDVGNAVPSAGFNDLANIDARLGNYFWLGFIITGLSPDKKRPALHGAQR